MLFIVGGRWTYKDKLELYQISSQIFERKIEIYLDWKEGKIEKKKAVQKLENLRVLHESTKNPC
jgi:hypothetical protein